MPFTNMSVAKPFVYALVCDAVGQDEAERHIGANATALPFDSPEAISHSAGGRTNPMVNPGATLADGGVNPVSGERPVGQEMCRFVLAAMITAGLHETSGD